MYFRHISAKIQPKNWKLFYYQVLVRSGNNLIGGLGPSGPSWYYTLLWHVDHSNDRGKKNLCYI